MFEVAAKKHYRWKCGVGGGTDANDGGSYGMGCVLDSRHVLTARHCWSGISNKYSWPIALRTDGLFRCEVIFESIPHDILILRSTNKIVMGPGAESTLRSFAEYPVLSKKQIFLGSSVGFMSNLQLYKSADDTELHPHFAAGFVSMILPERNGKALRFALSSTVIQSGFSGSPVFTTDGSIVGVVVERQSFRADYADVTAPIYTLPVISPICHLAHEIESAMSK
jgi:hypothetical protein